MVAAGGPASFSSIVQAHADTPMPRGIPSDVDISGASSTGRNLAYPLQAIERRHHIDPSGCRSTCVALACSCDSNSTADSDAHPSLRRPRLRPTAEIILATMCASAAKLSRRQVERHDLRPQYHRQAIRTRNEIEVPSRDTALTASPRHPGPSGNRPFWSAAFLRPGAADPEDFRYTNQVRPGSAAQELSGRPTDRLPPEMAGAVAGHAKLEAVTAGIQPSRPVPGQHRAARQHPPPSSGCCPRRPSIPHR